LFAEENRYIEKRKSCPEFRGEKGVEKAGKDRKKKKR